MSYMNEFYGMTCCWSISIIRNDVLFIFLDVSVVRQVSYDASYHAFIRVTHMYDMSYMKWRLFRDVSVLSQVSRDTSYHSFTCVTCLVHMYDMCYMNWLIVHLPWWLYVESCPMWKSCNSLYIWHAVLSIFPDVSVLSFFSLMWRSARFMRTWDMTHCLLFRDVSVVNHVCVCVSLSVVSHVLDNTSCDTFICAAWLIHMCDVTHCSLSLMSLCGKSCLTWHIIWLIHMRDMTQWSVWHDSLFILLDVSLSLW